MITINIIQISLRQSTLINNKLILSYVIGMSDPNPQKDAPQTSTLNPSDTNPGAQGRPSIQEPSNKVLGQKDHSRHQPEFVSLPTNSNATTADDDDIIVFEVKKNPVP
jgi:hypothetical protein